MTRNELLSAYKQLEQQQDHPDSAQLTQALEKAKAEKEAWIEKALAKEEQVAALEQQLESQEATALRVRSSLEQRLHQLEKEISPREPEPGSFPTSGKSTFRLELYHPDQGPLHGRIEHLLSRNKQTFQGLDANQWLTFVQQHLPAVASPAAPALTATEPPMEPQPQRPAEQAPASAPSGRAEVRTAPLSLRISGFYLAHADRHHIPNQLDRRQPIWAQLNLEGLPSSYVGQARIAQVMIYAKPLQQKGSITLLDTTQGCPLQPQLRWELSNQDLTPGPYRVGTNVRVEVSPDEPGAPPPACSAACLQCP